MLQILVIILGSVIGTIAGLSIGWWIGELQTKRKNRNYKVKNVWSFLFKNN